MRCWNSFATLTVDWRVRESFSRRLIPVWRNLWTDKRAYDYVTAVPLWCYNVGMTWCKRSLYSHNPEQLLSSPPGRSSFTLLRLRLLLMLPHLYLGYHSPQISWTASLISLALPFPRFIVIPNQPRFYPGSRSQRMTRNSIKRMEYFPSYVQRVPIQILSVHSIEQA